jgi:hypothetical protein
MTAFAIEKQKLLPLVPTGAVLHMINFDAQASAWLQMGTWY